MKRNLKGLILNLCDWLTSSLALYVALLRNIKDAKIHINKSKRIVFECPLMVFG